MRARGLLVGCCAAMVGCWSNVIVREMHKGEFPESEARCAVTGSIDRRFYEPLASYAREHLIPAPWSSEARVHLVDASRHEQVSFPGPRGAEILIDPRGDLGELDVRYWSTRKASGSMGTVWFPRTETQGTQCVHVTRTTGEVTLVLEGRSWEGHSEMMSAR
jgi:hypothetical protein